MICRECKIDKQEDCFAWKQRGVKRSGQCKECLRNYSKKHYRQNIEYYAKKTRRINEELKRKKQEFVYKYLLNNSCVDCGETDIRVLQFDHLQDKVLDVGNMLHRLWSWDKLKAEIEKCLVRCANCHTRKTCKEMAWAKQDFWLAHQGIDKVSKI